MTKDIFRIEDMGNLINIFFHFEPFFSFLLFPVAFTAEEK